MQLPVLGRMLAPPTMVVSLVHCARTSSLRNDTVGQKAFAVEDTAVMCVVPDAFVSFLASAGDIW